LSDILGYGEDSLTLWALRHRRPLILQEFDDSTSPTDCLAFYRPSFGRRGGRGSQFGEFDGILVSGRNVYLIESKWKKVDSLDSLRPEQELRHRIFAWYLTHWGKEYELGQHERDWGAFRQKCSDCFRRDFETDRKTIPTSRTELARNLRSTLSRIRTHYERYSSKQCIESQNVKNVLLFFHRGGTSPPPEFSKSDFCLIAIDYGDDALDSFIDLS